MSDSGGNRISVDYTSIAIVILYIMTRGEPDLIDALHNFLTSCG